MRAGMLLLLIAPLLLSSSALAEFLAQPAVQPVVQSAVQESTEPLGQAVERARAEQLAAEQEEALLNRAVGKAQGEDERLRAGERAAAQGIDAAEARITVADARIRLVDAAIAEHRELLAREEQPASLLLAGLAVMAQRPPLMALAGGGGTDELVDVRILLARTLPTIRARTARISVELAEGQRLQRVALLARSDLAAGRQALVGRRALLVALEQAVQHRLLATGGQALSAGDAALAAGEDVERLRGAQADSRGIRTVAKQLASEAPAPARPTADGGQVERPAFAFALPAAAPVTQGLAAVSDSGVRSRGVTLATARGAPLSAPADGIVRFAAPFRDYDGVIIIDHGGGWMSLVVNLSTQLKPGDRVGFGDPLGRALGPIEVGLSHHGRQSSPALIAGSSGPLSKGAKGR
ncbi:MAG: peptidoglycan DD-metalloendopeptidase family protein [Sphingomicrobium sp.]